MIAYNTSEKNKFLPCSVTVQWNLNSIIVDGSFQAPATKFEFFRLQKNCQYLFERISVIANIPEDDFLDSIISVVPSVSFYRKSTNTNIMLNPFYINGYVREKDISIFLESSIDEIIELQMVGRLNQISSLVGRTDIKFSIVGNIFLYDSNSYQKYMSEKALKKYE